MDLVVYICYLKFHTYITKYYNIYIYIISCKQFSIFSIELKKTFDTIDHQYSLRHYTYIELGILHYI